MKILMATNNKGKIKELKSILQSEMLNNKVQIELLTLEDVGINEDIPETADTAEGNALMKAEYVRALTNYTYPVIADDSVLEVAALSEKFQESIPGVNTGRYFEKRCELYGEYPSDLEHLHEHNMKVDRDEINIEYLLKDLESFDDRGAIFKTVLCYVDDSNNVISEGILNLNISKEKRGSNGFGFDPILEYNGVTLAEMSDLEKEEISHRTKASKELAKSLKQMFK